MEGEGWKWMELFHHNKTDTLQLFLKCCCFNVWLLPFSFQVASLSALAKLCINLPRCEIPCFEILIMIISCTIISDCGSIVGRGEFAVR